MPLHNIYLSSDLVNGPVDVGIRQTFLPTLYLLKVLICYQVMT